MSKQTTGEFLSLLRKAAGYTQEDIADKLNVSNKTISSWETDRTMPDVLLLPAIADLYGVTADEILRGERAQPDKTIDEELTEKSKQAIRKNKYGKFKVKYFLLSCLSFMFGTIAFIASIVMLLWVKEWIYILLFSLGYAGIFICTVLTLFFALNIKVSEGVVYKEDLTPEIDATFLPINRKIRNLFFINSIPFAAGTVLFVIVSITSELMPQMLINGIPCVFFLMFGLIWHIITIYRKTIKNN